MAADRCLLDIGVLDSKRPSTKKDGRIDLHVALSHIDPAQRPAPSRLRGRTFGLVVDDTAREGHGWMLRDDFNEITDSSSPNVEAEVVDLELLGEGASSPSGVAEAGGGCTGGPAPRGIQLEVE